jgi:hypothetical protein
LYAYCNFSCINFDKFLGKVWIRIRISTGIIIECRIRIPIGIKRMLIHDTGPICNAVYRLRTPRQPHLLLLYSSPEVKTYRFHSGLGGDIMVMELMAEPRLAFTFPQQLL